MRPYVLIATDVRAIEWAYPRPPHPPNLSNRMAEKYPFQITATIEVMTWFFFTTRLSVVQLVNKLCTTATECRGKQVECWCQVLFN